MSDFDYLADLPGEDRERAWIKERLKTLSVREGIVLAAAAQSDPPESAMEAINRIQSLDDYMVRPGAGSYGALGLAYLREDTSMPEDALSFVDLTQVGQRYEDKHPGLFVGDCYVQYPEKPPALAYHLCGPLPEDSDWSVKLKLASPAVPDGVWLRLPGQNPYGDESSVEETLALRALHVNRWDECTLLEAKCILPQAGDLTEQYDNIADLIYDGTSLGYILAERGQGLPNFMERYAAALELEDCHDLRLALDISQNLKCYDWIPQNGLAGFAEKHLRDAGVSEDLIHTCGIDLEGYGAELMEEKRYELTADGSAYARRNSEVFHYQHSEPFPGFDEMKM